ncbi:hypothetical protein LTR64_005558 [Lithohypha guttulata]|uniref:uncharacterized protein n=1 Tax=Lithohypha guttulata TaxID=1690604 RepID=UPI002DE1CAAD|nr:hypothetical protein LTR51_002649 [Lithohypha guttulata]
MLEKGDAYWAMNYHIATLVPLNIMYEATTTSFVVSIACLVLVAIASIPHAVNAFQQHLTHRYKYQTLPGKYEDQDGQATEQSQSAFTDVPQRVLLVAASFTGLAVALAPVLLISTNSERADFALQQWFQFGTWTVLFVQSCGIYVTTTSIDKCRLGAWNSLSALLLAVSIAVEDVLLYFKNVYPDPQKTHAILSATQFILAMVIFFTSVSIPRRPELTKDGKPVDREYTVSLINRFTFSWPAPVLNYAAKNRTLTHDDLPVINYSMRAETLRQEFDAVGKKDKLWKQIFWSHKKLFAAQWSLQILTAITNFLPQIVLYTVLRLLEARDSGASNQFQLWIAAFGMGLAVALGAWLESLLFYVCFLKLGIPVYEQLSAVIFGKAIRKKDVKSAAKVDQDAEIRGEVNVTKDSALQNDQTKVTTEEEENDDDEEVTKTKQSTINLIGVDSKRVSDFCTYNYLFVGSAVKLVFAIIFLVKLIGWIPMLCGFAAPVVISPINYLISKKYSDAQDELMKYRDQKMAVVTEALQGIRQIKFSALEKDWYERILKTRRKELREQWKSFCYDTGLISIWIFGPACMSAISLASYAWINGTISASVAFTTLSIFEAIEMTLAVVPELVTEMIDAIVSARRIQSFMDSAELKVSTTAGDSISFQDATISWPSDEQEAEDRTFSLHDLNLSFHMGELNVISGRTGSGKSLLLSAIIGEADLLSGKLTVPRPIAEQERFDHKANRSNWIIPATIAYVSQIPWIENASLRDNILFGLPHDEGRYRKVLSASALEKDLEMLQDGDLTDIGANGINLSGGQKWRASFARALYSRAGILVLDDIFSAVDAHVGRQLYENALTGELCQGRTRILVTHHVALCLPMTKYIVLLGEGRALRADTVDNLRANGHLSDILAYDVEEQKKEEESANQEDALLIDDGGNDLTKIATNQSRRSRRASSRLQGDQATLALQRSRASATNGYEENHKSKDSPKKFTEEEARETGAISFQVYKTYVKACRGYFYWLCLAVVFLSWIGFSLGRSYWVSHWTRQYETEEHKHRDLLMSLQIPSWRQTTHHKLSTLRADKQSNDLLFYIGVYVAISFSAWIIGTIRYFTVFLASISGSHVMFQNLTNTILRAPLRFLDTTPVGRLSNRFTADFNMIDSRMASDLGFMLHCGISVLSVIIAGAFVSPIMLLFALLLVMVSGWFAKRFLRGAREVKRLESNAKSPIFEQFGSVLTGVGTIRAFGRTEAYLERMYARINTHCSCIFHVYLFSRWMSFRANMVGALFTFATAALIVSLIGIDASLAGFVLSFSLDLSESVIWALRQYANVELNFNAVERVIEFSNIETEDQGGDDAPAAWPTKGEIQVEDLVVSYSADLPPVLRNLNFNIEANERVGVVGRTGAGKSSLTLALFRFLEAQSGSIRIDGIDISKIKLYDLRSRLAIIPQDPVLFSGTVRSNLDPFDQHSDIELRDALARVHLLDPASSTQASGTATPIHRGIAQEGSLTGTSTPVNKNTALSLSTRISESGLNLSQGQRQLLCLARAIVSRPRILVLDEATSSVDMETDRLIQQSIREEFGGRCTLIVIAHRLSTIVDFERVLVLGQGQVVEYGTPKELYQSKDVKEGSFREMVEKSGEKTMLEEVMFEGQK